MRSPAPSSMARIAPIWFLPTASGLTIESVRSIRSRTFRCKGGFHRRAELGRALCQANARRLEGLDLVRCGPLPSRDDRSGMPHSLSLRSGLAADSPGHRLLHVLLDELGGLLFGVAADLADHDHTGGLGIVLEEPQHVDEVHTLDRIAADADASRLTEPQAGQLMDGLVGEGAAARHDAYRALLVDVTRHDADLALIGCDHTRAVGTDQPRRLVRHHALHAHHVGDRNAFGDANDERHAGVDRLQDRVGGKRRRHVDNRSVGVGGSHRLLNRIEDRDAFEIRAALAGRHAGHHLRAVLLARMRVKLSGRAGDTLGEDPRVLVDEDAHRAATAFTTFSAASAMFAQGVMFNPDSERIFLPSSTLVPSSRTTSGTDSFTSLAAATMPEATTSHFMMPPKMLTRIAFPFFFVRRALDAAVRFWLVAPPQTRGRCPGDPP